MTKEDIIKPENLVYKKPTLMNDNPMHYCPGCSHGVNMPSLKDAKTATYRVSIGP